MKLGMGVGFEVFIAVSLLPHNSEEYQYTSTKLNSVANQKADVEALHKIFMR
jgi:hypothetical protein